MLIANPDIAFAFRRIVRTVEHAKVYMPYTRGGEFNKVFNLENCIVTSVTDNKEYFEFFKKEIDDGKIEKGKNILYMSKPEYFKPESRFHYSFCFPPFNDDLSPINVSDSMVFFECSKHGNEDEMRSGPLHLMCLEGMNSSVMPGLFFGAIMPRNWSGRKMSYLKWFNDNIPTVAKIKLPKDSIKVKDKENERRIHGEDFFLFVFCKQMLVYDNEKLAFATFRYNTFNYSLSSLNENDIEEMGKRFERHDWCENYVKLFNDFLDENRAHPKYKHVSYDSPVLLKDPSEVIILDPNNKFRLKYIQFKNLDEIKDDSRGVILKPMRSRVILKPVNTESEFLLNDLKSINGYFYGEEKELKNNFDNRFNDRQLYQIKDELIKAINSSGLNIYLSIDDISKIKAQRKWLEKQLTPIERTVRDYSVNGNSNGNGNDVNSVNKWIAVFEDIGLGTVYKEEVEMWKNRAKKMRLSSIPFDFQMDDIAKLATKQSCLNCNVMGLGKTLESLLLAVLRGVEKVLIIVPTKLIGEWQKELENKVIPFCKLQRRHWSGKKIGEKSGGISYQVIEWAEQCKPQNLKLFNIISYERLGRKPRDAYYFHCPSCGFVVCSTRQVSEQACPKCNEGRRMAWKEKCNKENLKLYLRCEDDSSKEYGRKVYGCIKKKGDGIEVTLPNYKERGYKIINDRPPLGSLQMMDRKHSVFKKMKKVQSGYTEEVKLIDGVDGNKTKITVNTPKYEFVERSPHLKWCFAGLLRRRFNFVIIDEATYIKSESTNRTKAVHNVCAKTKYALTGTPIRGYPKSILSLINFTIDKVAFPDYRTNENRKALSRFYEKYATTVTNLDTGYRKILPKINNPELFQTEIAPFMLRHTRNEPEVLKSIPKKEVRGPDKIAIPMDENHRRYYSLWIEKFSEWWQKMKEEEENKKTGMGQILVKLGYLINASTIPHFMLENISESDEEGKIWANLIGPYKGPKTQKQVKCFSMVNEVGLMGDKCLVFSIRRKNLRLGEKWCKNQNINNMLVDGTVSNTIQKNTNRSKRQMMIERFRHYSYVCMWAGLTALSEGVNIPEANHAIFMDLSWEPSEARQALGRMIRPQQEKTVYATHLAHLGTIDEFISMYNILKARSMDEGIDYKEFDDFSSDMIPDPKQYANAIVDGTESVLKSRMETQIDKLKKLKESGEDFEEQGFYEED